MSDGEGKTKLLGSAPSGSRKRPVTEVIDDSLGPSLRRIRKLRVVLVDVPDARDLDLTRVFAQDEVRFGSSPEVDVTLRDAAVSREHLAVRLGPHGFSLSDVGSTNGTFVGDLRVERVSFGEDILVRLGNSVVRLEPLAETVEQEISPRARFGRMLGASPTMRETFALLERVASTDLTVLQSTRFILERVITTKRRRPDGSIQRRISRAISKSSRFLSMRPKKTRN